MRNHFEEIELPDVAIHESLAFQERDWLIQRIGWGLGAAVLLVALIGVFGGGPISNASVSDSSGAITIEYSRFERWSSPITIHAALHSSEGETVKLWIAQSYLDGMRIDSITPQPKSVALNRHRMEFEFSSPGENPLRIEMHLTPEQFGQRDAEFGVVGGPQVRFWQFVYP